MPNHTLSIVTGQPAVGKTTWGMALAQRQNATFIDIDVVSEPIVRAALKLANMSADDRDSKVFKAHFRQPIYESLFATAKVNLTHNNVVITGPFTKELEQKQWKEELMATFQCNVEIYWLTADEEAIRERMQKRGNSNDTLIKQRLKRYDLELSFKEKFNYCFINENLDITTKEVEKIIKEYIK